MSCKFQSFAPRGHAPQLRISTALLCGVLGLSAAAFADDKLPPAEDVLDKHVEAAGGKAAFEKLHNRVTKGTIEFSIGVKGPFTSWQAEPCKLVIQTEAEGLGKILDGTDGETAWSITTGQGPRIKEGVERAEALRQSQFNSELHWRKLWKKVETLGVENVNDKPAYKIELTPDAGKPVLMYFDKESGLCAKLMSSAESTRGPIPIETMISDYRKIGDVMLPFKQVQSFEGMSTTFVIDSIEHNVELPKTKFDLPIEIRQLQEKLKP